MNKVTLTDEQNDRWTDRETDGPGDRIRITDSYQNYGRLTLINAAVCVIFSLNIHYKPV